jgi:hypothetical protein
MGIADRMLEPPSGFVLIMHNIRCLLLYQQHYKSTSRMSTLHLALSSAPLPSHPLKLSTTSSNCKVVLQQTCNNVKTTLAMIIANHWIQQQLYTISCVHTLILLQPSLAWETYCAAQQSSRLFFSGVRKRSHKKWTIVGANNNRLR